MNRPELEISAYLDGDLSPEQARTLEDWINASPENASAFLYAIQMDQLIGERIHANRMYHQLTHREKTQDGIAFQSLKRGVFDQQTLKLLLEIEASAPDPELVDLTENLSQRHPELVRKLPASQPRARPQARRIQPLAGGVVAAVLLLVIGLLWSQNDAGTSTTPKTQPAQATSVASLTAQHDARWATTGANKAVPTVGDKLMPGQTLILLHGSAELTTARGARIILESPCTVELIANDNALHLHHGKLVARVDTELAKGLLVRTDHMSVIDLGTMFGVDATRSDETEAHVFIGEIEVVRPTASTGQAPMRQRLTQGQAVRAGDEVANFVRLTTQPALFEATRFPLEGTGHGLVLGQIDPTWQIVSMNGQTLDTPLAVYVSENPKHVEFLANDPATSQWLTCATPAQSTVVFRTQIDLPRSIDPNTARILVQFMPDNKLNSIRVNGLPIPVAEHDLNRKFDQLFETVIDDHFTTGINTIDFEVLDYGNTAALRLDWTIHSDTAWPEWAKQE